MCGDLNRKVGKRCGESRPDRMSERELKAIVGEDDFASLSRRNVIQVALGSFKKLTESVVIAEVVVVEKNQPLNAGVDGNIDSNKWSTVPPVTLFDRLD